MHLELSPDLGATWVAAACDANGKLQTTGGAGGAAVTSATATAPAQTTVGTTAVQLLAANVNRKRLIVQNTGTTILKLAFGATPTQTAYHLALSAGGAADNGTGASLIDELWTGAVQGISSAAGGTCVVTEMT